MGRAQRCPSGVVRYERWASGFALCPSYDADMAQVWGRLRVPHPENPLDKQIAATALVFDLTIVTRNVAHFSPTGARVLNPFE